MTYAATAAGLVGVQLLVLLVVVLDRGRRDSARGVPRGGRYGAARSARRRLGTVGGMETRGPGDGREETTLCEWCGGQVRQSGVGRRRAYCGRSCQQRAYEERRTQRRIAEAVDGARTVSSREGTGALETSRDETVPAQVGPGSGGDFLLAPPVPAVPVDSVLPDAWRAPVARRPLSRRRSGITASPMPLLWDDADGE
ncbi:hypothetical protein [Streptomyces sp. NPDC012825]|uniref:hypothetical protein n=1 Tax=Streptomyces sp. NPDC012825 TaxID=3364851 RepID=UPI003678F477